MKVEPGKEQKIGDEEGNEGKEQSKEKEKEDKGKEGKWIDRRG